MAELFLAIATTLLGQAAPPAQDPKTVITDQEAIDFARKIERGLLDGKAEAFSDVLDMEALLEVGARGLDLTPAEVKNLRANLNLEIQWGRQLAPASGVSYRFLGLRSVRSDRGPLFRHWNENGFGYHLYKLGKTPSGSLRITDLLFFISGEWQSSVLRRTSIAILLDDPARRSKVDAKDAESARDLVEMRAFARLVRKGESQEALEVFDALPEGVRKDRQAQAMRLIAATSIGGPVYLKAEEEFRRLFPDDLGLDLISIDGFVLRKEFDKALQALDRLDRLVGDPLLDVLRGNMHVGIGDLVQAKKAGERAAKEVPYLVDPRQLLVTVSLRQKAHSETVRLLIEIEKEFKVVMDETSEEYAEFVKSQEYRDWLRSRAAK